MTYRLSARRQAIAEALDAYLRGDVPDLDPALRVLEREVAHRHQAVPIFRNTADTIFLQKSGALFAWDHVAPASAEDIRPLDPMTVRLTFLLAAGSRVHPALAPLLPDRPSRARDCHACGGAGFHHHAGDFCHVCDALGWVIDNTSA